MDLGMLSNIIGCAGIVTGVAGFFLAFLTAVPTLFSTNKTVQLIGCKFLSTALLFAVLCIGMVGPLLNFSIEIWLVYRALMVLAMIFACVTIYRLYKDMHGE